jgi:hypothetical protein
MANTVELLANPAKGVDQKHDQYLIMEPWLKLVDDLRQGTARLREEHDAYLPKFADEKPENYKRRWMQATLYDAFEDTVGMLTGKVFSKPPALDEDVPVEILGTDAEPGLMEDIDREGNHFQVFAQNLFKQGLRSGLVHLLVDSTPIPPGIGTEAEKKAAGHRPYWVMYRASQVFAWRYKMEGGRPVLSQVRIREAVEEEDGEFGTTAEEQIRVLEPGRFRIFRKDEDGQWKEIKEGDPSGNGGGPIVGYDGKPLNYIPLVTFYADEDNGFMTAIPPLLDLAYQSIRHFQKQSDYDNVMTVACFPIFCATGIITDETEITLGPLTVCKSTSENAKFYYAEHSGAAITSARTDLQDLKEDMAKYGLRMLMPRTGQAPTATGEAINEAKTTSQLQVAALRLRDCLETALAYTARWLGKGKDAGGSVKVDLRGITLSLQDIDQVLKAAGCPQKILLDTKTAITVLQDKGWLNEDIDPVEVEAALQNQALQSSAVGGLAGSFLRPPAAPGTAAPVPGATVQ